MTMPRQFGKSTTATIATATSFAFVFQSLVLLYSYLAFILYSYLAFILYSYLAFILYSLF